MANISVSLPSDGSTADVSDYNTPVNTIVNEINGNLDNTNIKSGAAIATSKLADDAGITTAKIADDAVTAAKVDWASTGANGGIWWEELGRTTLSGAGDTISVTSIPARKYLMILISVLPTGGTIGANITFNNDTANNYALRVSNNGGADSTSTSRANWSSYISPAAVPGYVVVEIVNISNQEKIGIYRSVEQNTAGAGTAPQRTERVGKWANTSAQITRVDVGNDGTGDFAIGSEVIVLGHN